MQTTKPDALRARAEAAEAEAKRLSAALEALLDAIGACRRPIVGTETWLRAWPAMLESAEAARAAMTPSRGQKGQR